MYSKEQLVRCVSSPSLRLALAHASGHTATTPARSGHTVSARRISAQPTLVQQTIAVLQEKLSVADANILKLEHQVEGQRGCLGVQEMDNRRLRALIDQMRDIEEVFRTDTSFHHGFKKFLKDSFYHAERPGC